MLFSVVTVCLNAETSIGRCVRSVLEQRDNGSTFSDYEYVIIDGGSTDDTLAIAQSFALQFEGRMRVVSEPDGGIYDAMNKGLAAASGDYIVFANADDWLEPDALATVARSISAADSAPGWVGGAIRVHDSAGSVATRLPVSSEPDDVLPVRMPVQHQAMFVSVGLMRSLGGFDPRYRIAADYDLYLRLREARASYILIQRPLANFMLGGASYALMATAREYREVRVVHGMPRPQAWLLYFKNVLASVAVRIAPG